MNGEWAYWQNYFTPETCDKIVELAMKLTPEKPSVGGLTGDAVRTLRRSTVRWITEENPDFTFLFDEYWKIMVRINRDFFGFNITHLPPIQFTEYHATHLDEYKSHQDIFWITNTSRHRKATIITQLSPRSNYDGGELVLEHLNQYPPKEKIETQGTVISFPSFVYHSLKPVTRGTRYSLVGWFEGPQFQ